MKGGKLRAEADEAKQLLFVAKEKALVQWITKVSQNEYTLWKSYLWEMAEDIRQQCVSEINDVSIILVKYPLIGEE